MYGLVDVWYLLVDGVYPRVRYCVLCLGVGCRVILACIHTTRQGISPYPPVIGLHVPLLICFLPPNQNDKSHLAKRLDLNLWNILLSTISNCHHDIHKCWHICHLGKGINFLLWHLISWNISLPLSQSKYYICTRTEIHSIFIISSCHSVPILIYISWKYCPKLSAHTPPPVQKNNTGAMKSPEKRIVLPRRRAFLLAHEEERPRLLYHSSFFNDVQEKFADDLEKENWKLFPLLLSCSSFQMAGTELFGKQWRGNISDPSELT